MIKVCCISDTHAQEHLVEVPECDLLIHAGDVGTRLDLPELHKFLTWFSVQPATKRVFVGGNHDIILDIKEIEKITNSRLRTSFLDQHQRAMNMVESFDVVYLQDSGYEFEGLKIWGSPYTPSFYRQHWAFNADRGDEIKTIWDKIPDSTDVLITHGPPLSVMDEIDNRRVGCVDLLRTVEDRLKGLKLHVFGHIHEGAGMMTSGDSIFWNAAILDDSYRIVVKKPRTIEL